MPDRPIHDLIDVLAGIPLKKGDYVNKMMDLPSQLYGSNHRFLFHGQHSYKINTPSGVIRLNHFAITNKDLIEIYALTGFDRQKLLAWYLHVMADGVNKDTITTFHRSNKKHR